MTTAYGIRRPATAFALSSGKKRPREKNAAHLDFIRSLPCIVTGGEAEAAHVRYSSLPHGKRATGASERPHDRWAVPLSPEQHRLGNHSQHSMNEQAYWKGVGIDPLIIAALLWGATGDYEAGVLICQHARETAKFRP